MAGTNALTKSNTDFISEFRILAERIASEFATCGLKVRSFRDPNLIYYSKLSPELQAQSLQRLRVYYDSIHSAVSSGERIDNNSQSLWHALRVFGFTPDSEIFSKFENDDVIEVYDSKGTQIWRNFNYMKICSYTFEELLCHDWPTLYRRDQKLTESLVQLMVDTVSTADGPKFIDVDYHLVEECFSIDELRLSVRHDYICPLFGPTKKRDGFIVTSKVKILGSNRGIRLEREPELGLA